MIKAPVRVVKPDAAGAALICVATAIFEALEPTAQRMVGSILRQILAADELDPHARSIVECLADVDADAPLN